MTTTSTSPASPTTEPTLGDAVRALRSELTPDDHRRIGANIARVNEQARAMRSTYDGFVIYGAIRPAIATPRPCGRRVHHGRAPRQRTNHRRGGSRRTSTSARAGPDDPDLDPEHPAVASSGGRP